MSRSLSPWQADLLLLLGAFFWGTTFVPQRLAADNLEPFAYNAARFALGALVVLPLALRRMPTRGGEWRIGLLTGLALAAASAFQQAGMEFTTAANGGFITGFYVVLVPIAALALRITRRTEPGVWWGALLALVGMYFISVPPGGIGGVNRGDVLVLTGAFCWTAQILLLDHFSPGRNPFLLSCVQNAACAAGSLIISLGFETTTAAGLAASWWHILYAGVLSAGVAFTLQVVAQRDSPPAHAAVIMSLEAVFAALAGALCLGETFTLRGGLGAALMLAGMLAAQAHLFRRKPAPAA
jgi:drug/metabolite transporter (DMT)-like permease